MRFVGIDLAWSPGRPSAIVVLDERGEVQEAAWLAELEALAAFCLMQRALGPVTIAVDAPLRVPNFHGHRSADRELMRLFRPYRLGAHVASRQRLQQVHGCLRGEQLAAALCRAFGRPGSDGAAGSAGVLGEWQLMEVYPHAALIAWFDLAKPLAYKRGQLARRRQELRRMAALLDSLQASDPPLRLGGAPWLPADDGWDQLSTAQLRHVEGLLDAVVCAHVARYYHRWGRARCRVLGSPEEGELVTPIPNEAPGASGP